MIDREDFAEVVVIGITAEDIANGVQEDCELCPGALAALRTFEGHSVTVTHTYVYVDLDNEGDRFVVYRGGESLSTFTHLFDRGEEVEPTSIALTLDRNWGTA